MVVIFVDIGQEVYVSGDLSDAINKGVAQGYRDGYLRASIVSDPINRKNTGDNTPAVIHFNIIPGDKLKITVMPKGFGSENKGAVKMLNPSAGIEGIEAFVIEAVKNAGADPCPPIVVGVGIGGTMEKAALLAKEALLLPPKDVLQCSHTGLDPESLSKQELTAHASESRAFWGDVEARLLDKINALNIGTAGLKGKTTALSVSILTHPTHIAGLPVAVNIGCHVARHKTATL